MIAATPAKDTLAARELERGIYALMVSVEERDGENVTSDVWCALRLAWMEAGRSLETLCERDGVSRWAYRWMR